MSCCRDSHAKRIAAELHMAGLVEESDELEAIFAEPWEGGNLPEGWTQKSVEKFWASLTGDRKHKVTQCMKKMKGKVSDPGAFCGSLASKVGYR